MNENRIRENMMILLREKLKDLLKEAKELPKAERCVACPRPQKGGKRPCAQCELERTVDYLIENGVTVR